MARGEHPPSCAKKIRLHATDEGWSLARTVRAICEHCGVSPMKAHRLARGWTLATAAEQFHATVGNGPRSPHLNEDQLNAWENGRGRPCAETIDLLCQFYRTGPVQLGVAVDYSDDPVHDKASNQRGAAAEINTSAPAGPDAPIRQSSGRHGGGRVVLEVDVPDPEEDDVRRRRRGGV